MFLKHQDLKEKPHKISATLLGSQCPKARGKRVGSSGGWGFPLILKSLWVYSFH